MKNIFKLNLNQLLQKILYAISIRWKKILCMAIIILTLIVLINGFITRNFRDLPLGATNGDWSAKAVRTGHPHLFYSIEHLAERVPNILRVQVISSSDRMLFSARGPEWRHVFTVYTLRVLDVFKGDIEKESYIEARQIRSIAMGDDRRRGRTHILPKEAYHFGRDYPSYIRIPIEIEDDLILFLHDPRRSEGFPAIPPRILTIQGVYRYTPKEVRVRYDNWMFESVNEHNNLILTEKDLLQIKKR